MIDLPWTPRWYQFGISLWALAARIAHVSTAGIDSILDYLVGASNRNRAAVWFGTRETIQRVTHELQLPEQWSSLCFSAVAPMSLEERQHYRLALRWCPRCLEQWYHSPKFQHSLVARCPIHSVPLLDRCPHCSRFVDPLAVVEAWSCGECRQPLAAPPGDWRIQFASNVGAVRDAQLLDATWRRSDYGTSVWIQPGQRTTVDSYEDLMQRFDYLSAVWDTLAAVHRSCAHEETTAGLGQYSGFEFRCPVAAAILQSGLLLGVPSEVNGGWPSFKSSRARSDWQLDDRECPAWAVPVVTREQTRLFVRSALEHLTTAVKRGWSEAIWRHDFAPTIKTSTTSRGMFLSDAVSEAQLLKAFINASESCTRFQANSACVSGHS